MNIVKICRKNISPEDVINKVQSQSSGCVVAYVGLIREYNQNKQVFFVEYKDPENKAEDILRGISLEVIGKWSQIENIAIYHRIGKLKVGEINLVVAIAAAHRSESFSACQYAIDQFKEKLPTEKTEVYRSDSDKH